MLAQLISIECSLYMEILFTILFVAITFIDFFVINLTHPCGM